MSCDEDADFNSRAEEIEVIASIYPEMIRFQDDLSIDFQVSSGTSDKMILLRVTLPPNYPFEMSPNFEISAPFLISTDKEEIKAKLNEISSSNLGSPVLFECIEEVRTFLFTLPSESSVDELPSSEIPADEIEVKTSKCPEIITGSCLEDRKSVFQGHFAKVTNCQEVNTVIEELLKNRKIANATHNIWAYRIRHEGSGRYSNDCDDDGETHAGSRLLHLLDILDVYNVLVVVTRWYGGIQLGPDRFRHINNVARSLLEQVEAIPRKSQK